MASTPKILIVDDEPTNIRILEIDLEDLEVDIITACDGVDGWEKLQQHKDEICVILLDRMMPNMNGMEFMAKLKSQDDVANIPVIMQTAAAEKEQVKEGIDAGVYYYLTKPYDLDVMCSVVEAAMKDYSQYNMLRQELKTFKSKLHLVKESHFEVQHIDDAKYLSTFLANFFPDPNRVVLGILELLVNGIEHGNLGITYQEKTELNNSGTWEEEVARRIALPENKNKKVAVHYVKKDDKIELTISDEGTGFDWQPYLDISPDRAMDNHGRGIAMSRMVSFDSLEYQGNGSSVCCTINLKAALQQAC